MDRIFLRFAKIYSYYNAISAHELFKVNHNESDFFWSVWMIFMKKISPRFRRVLCSDDRKRTRKTEKIRNISTFDWIPIWNRRFGPKTADPKLNSRHSDSSLKWECWHSPRLNNSDLTGVWISRAPIIENRPLLYFDLGLLIGKWLQKNRISFT